MRPQHLGHLAKLHGSIEEHSEGKIFHAQNFPQKLFLIKSGYIKRYQATKPEKKVLELIYGPGQLVSLSQIYKKIFGVDQNQDNYIYVYQALTDVTMCSLGIDLVVAQLEKDPDLYKEFFYQSGLILRSNVSRLASNALPDDYQKVAHQLVSLAYEFTDMVEGDVRKTFTLPLPQSALDIAEQLNISKEVAEAILDRLCKNEIIKRQGPKITILNTDLLKDIYL